MQKKISFKNEKGAMAVYAIAMILSFVVILSGMFTVATAIRKNQLRTMMKIKEIYAQDVNNIQTIYYQNL